MEKQFLCMIIFKEDSDVVPPTDCLASNTIPSRNLRRAANGRYLHYFSLYPLSIFYLKTVPVCHSGRVEQPYALLGVGTRYSQAHDTYCSVSEIT